jgi:hypothetical protein
MCKSDRIARYALRVDPLVWKLASLLYDIGYPVQILCKQMEKFFKKIETFKRENLPKKNASVILWLASSCSRIRNLRPYSALAEQCFRSLEILYRGDNAFELLKRRLADFDLRIDLKSYFYGKANEGHVDHGIFSALIALNLIDALYAKHNPKSLPHLSKRVKEGGRYYKYIDWGRDWFDREVVDAAAVISLHNLVQDPILQHYRIDLDKVPTLYLLTLSDSIQVWRRHSVFREVYPPNSINLFFTPKEIRCALTIADEEKTAIRDVLERRLTDDELALKVP